MRLQAQRHACFLIDEELEERDMTMQERNSLLHCREEALAERQMMQASLNALERPTKDGSVA
jgi:hypothetical protein